nr:acyl-CoA thioesterase domain-containing protein [Pseudomaricurvus alkylphenolicus]
MARVDPEEEGRLYGGTIIAKSILAAHGDLLIDDAFMHSMHGYFLRPGQPDFPIFFELMLIRKGRSFATYQITAKQDGKEIFLLVASFQVRESGLEFQNDMPKYVGPHDLPALEEFRRNARPKRFLHSEIDIRPVNKYDLYQNSEIRDSKATFWVKSKLPVKEEPGSHEAFLGFVSDMYLLDISLMPHGLNHELSNLKVVSLDHSMWFHRSFRTDEWLLIEVESMITAGARGFNLGRVYRSDGTLVASLAQEGLIRVLDET